MKSLLEIGVSFFAFLLCFALTLFFYSMPVLLGLWLWHKLSTF